MSYSKADIELLFIEYVGTGSDRVFGELIESCCPIMDIILSRYSGDYIEDRTG